MVSVGIHYCPRFPFCFAWNRIESSASCVEGRDCGSGDPATPLNRRQPSPSGTTAGSV